MPWLTPIAWPLAVPMLIKWFFICPTIVGTYYGMALSVRPSVVRPSSVRPSSVVFRLTRAQVHISLRIILILSIRVYDHKTLNEFDNHHDPIQNGRPAAILFFSVDTRSSPHFFTNQPHIWHMGISIPNAERVRKPPWSDSKWPPGGHFGDFGDDVSAQNFFFFKSFQYRASRLPMT